MGFSILSAAELLYFLLIRWIYYRFKNNNEQERRAQLSSSDSTVVDTLNDNSSKNTRFNPPSYRAWMTEQSRLDDQIIQHHNH